MRYFSFIKRAGPLPVALALALALPPLLRAADAPEPRAAERAPAPPPGTHEIEGTGWGILPPPGFVPAEGYKDSWKPSAAAPRRGPLARNALIRVYSAFSEEACAAVCAGQPVPEKSVHRSKVRGRPAASFECREQVFHFGMAWTQGDYVVVQVSEEACVIVALLARSGEARRQALSAFRQAQLTLAPLPKRSEPAPAEDEALQKKPPLLR